MTAGEPQRLTTEALRWGRAALADTALASEPDILYDFSIIAHPLVPAPHLCMVVFLSIRSHARLGGRIATTQLLELTAVDEAQVGAVMKHTAGMLVQMRRDELAAAKGPGSDGTALPPGVPGVPPMQWPPT